MLQYILHRLLLMIPTVFGISILCFGIIQLPPGDFLTFYVAELSAQGEDVPEAQIAQLERQYGLGRPWYVQYFLWMKNIITKGDFGRSFTWNKPVSDLIWDRIAFTMMITLLTVVFVWIVALFIGKYAATHQPEGKRPQDVFVSLESKNNFRSNRNRAVSFLQQLQAFQFNYY